MRLWVRMVEALQTFVAFFVGMDYNVCLYSGVECFLTLSGL